MNLKKIHLILFLKPCYKWNTFNIELESLQEIKLRNQVLNLIITGMPSILKLNSIEEQLNHYAF